MALARSLYVPDSAASCNDVRLVGDRKAINVEAGGPPFREWRLDGEENVVNQNIGLLEGRRLGGFG